MGFEQRCSTDVTAHAPTQCRRLGPAQQPPRERPDRHASSLFAVVVNYPDLKADQNVLDLQEELTTTKNQISFSRQHYNARVLNDNTGIATFPSDLIAGLSASPSGVLDAEPEAQEVPKVNLNLAAPPPRAGPCHRHASTSRTGQPANPIVMRRFILAVGSARVASGTRSSGAPAGAAGVAATVFAIVAFIHPRRVLRGDSLVLAVSGARGRQRQAPQLMNVVQELAIAANIPMPRVYVIGDTAPNAFATGRDPQHAAWRSRGTPPEARSRGAPGRHRSRAVARAQPRHAFRARRRDLVGSIALLADFFLRFTFWGGVTGRARDSDSGGGGPGADHVRGRSRAGHRRAHRRRPRPARRQPTARVPGRRVERRVTRNPWPRARAGQDRRRQGSARGRQPRHAAPVLRQPDQEIRSALVGADADPPTDRRPHQPAARLTGEAPLDAQADG